MPDPIPRKRIWSGDKVRVIGGMHDGVEGNVEKREPKVGALAKYVWIRQARRPNGHRGYLVKVSVRFVVIVEKTKDNRHDRHRDRSKYTKQQTAREKAKRQAAREAKEKSSS